MHLLSDEQIVSRGPKAIYFCLVTLWNVSATAANKPLLVRCGCHHAIANVVEALGLDCAEGKPSVMDNLNLDEIAFGVTADVYSEITRRACASILHNISEGMYEHGGRNVALPKLVVEGVPDTLLALIRAPSSTEPSAASVSGADDHGDYESPRPSTSGTPFFPNLWWLTQPESSWLSMLKSHPAYTSLNESTALLLENHAGFDPIHFRIAPESEAPGVDKDEPSRERVPLAHLPPDVRARAVLRMRLLDAVVGPEHESMLIALLALAHLAQHPQNVPQMVRSGAMQAIEEFADSGVLLVRGGFCRTFLEWITLIPFVSLLSSQFPSVRLLSLQCMLRFIRQDASNVDRLWKAFAIGPGAGALREAAEGAHHSPFAAPSGDATKEEAAAARLTAETQMARRVMKLLKMPVASSPDDSAVASSSASARALGFSSLSPDLGRLIGVSSLGSLVVDWAKSAAHTASAAPSASGADSSSVSNSSGVSGLFSDTTFIVGPEDGGDADAIRTFHAHRSILAARLEVMRCMLTLPLAEGVSSHPVVRIPDVTPDGFQVLLHWIYTGDPVFPSPQAAADAAVAADKYGAAHLNALCDDYLAAATQSAE